MAKKERALDLTYLLNSIDKKNRDFYEDLDTEQLKEYSSYVALRWASSINQDGDIAKYYLLSANQQANKHLWDLNKHPKLQWLAISCISPGMGIQRHEFIAFKNKSAKNKRAQIIANLYPAMKIKEAEDLSDLMSDKEFSEYLKDLGWDDKKIKEAVSK